MEQLDESVPLLSDYKRTVVDNDCDVRCAVVNNDGDVKRVVVDNDDDVRRTVVDNDGDGDYVQQWEQGHGVDTFGRRDETAEDRPTRRPTKCWEQQGTRCNQFRRNLELGQICRPD